MSPGLKLLEKPKVSLCGPSALLFEPEGALSLRTQERIWTLAEVILDQTGVTDTQPGMNNLLVLLDPIALDASVLGEKLLRIWRRIEPRERKARIIEVGVIYGGEAGIDMRALSEFHGLSIQEVARLHSTPEYTVVAPGTAPGYGYLFGLDSRLFTPRKQVPVTRPLGPNVSIGGAQTALGTPSNTRPLETAPNGWYVIGHAPEAPPPYDFSKDEPFLVSLGDKIRFRIERVES